MVGGFEGESRQGHEQARLLATQVDWTPRKCAQC